MDGVADELLISAASQMSGAGRRMFLAAVCLKLCEGNTREAEVPRERTMRNILNRMNYRLKRIQKGKPLKKTKDTDAIFENVQAVRAESEAWL